MKSLFPLFLLASCYALCGQGAQSESFRVDTRTSGSIPPSRIVCGTERLFESVPGSWVPDSVEFFDQTFPAVDTTIVLDGWTDDSDPNHGRLLQNQFLFALNGRMIKDGRIVLDGPKVEGGRLSDDLAWNADRVRVVRDDVVVPSGVTLCIASDTVVKFTEGAKIVVEDGGTLVADGALFADFADDSVGGDTNLDGDSTTPTTAWEDWTEGVVEGVLIRVAFLDGASAAFPARAYTAGRPLGALPEPTREGALFTGWRTAPDGGDAVSSLTLASAATATLYASWMVYALDLAPGSTNLASTAGNVAFAVSANAAWTVSTSEGWITLRTRRGNGDGTAGFSVTANTSSMPRTGTVRVTLSEGGFSRDFTVMQAGMQAVAAPVVTPADGTAFRASAQRVAIRCATSGATIRYTLDGSEPTESSAVCGSGGFNVFDTTTIKAKAFKEGMLPSATVSVRLVRLQTLAEAIDVPLWTVTTDGDADWTVDTETASEGAGSSARSGSIGDEQTTSMRTCVEGSGTLSFRWKASCEDDPDDTWTWDYLVFEADGTELAHLDGQTGWQEVSVKLGPGTHALAWTFAKDFMDGEDVGEDCGWVDRVTWTPTVSVDDSAIPVSWFENQGLVALGGTAEAAASADPDGDGLTTAEEYVAGTDPNDPDSTLTANIEIIAGRPVVTWEPDLLGERTYHVLGRKTLDPAEEWVDVTDVADLDAEGYRFFKVKVESRH